MQLIHDTAKQSAYFALQVGAKVGPQALQTLFSGHPYSIIRDSGGKAQNDEQHLIEKI